MRARLALTALLAGAAMSSAPARAEDLMDLRGIRVGMMIQDLPGEGYQAFACTGAPTQKLSGWKDWKTCAADASGARTLTAAYDQPRVEGTFIAGHPVDLTLAFDQQSRLIKVVIETDPKARLYLRKKAYLLGQQAKYRYGEDRWDCQAIKPTGAEEPLGPTFIKEHCSKKLQDREVVVDRALYHKAGSNDPKNFVSESRVAIIWLGKPT